MALPVVPIPTATIELAGTPVTYRSLSRAEALRMATDYRADPEGAQVFLLARGAGVTEDEARAWLDSTDPATAGKLVDAIIILTGLATPDQVAAANGEDAADDPPA